MIRIGRWRPGGVRVKRRHTWGVGIRGRMLNNVRVKSQGKLGWIVERIKGLSVGVGKLSMRFFLTALLCTFDFIIDLRKNESMRCIYNRPLTRNQTRGPISTDKITYIVLVRGGRRQRSQWGNGHNECKCKSHDERGVLNFIFPAISQHYIQVDWRRVICTICARNGAFSIGDNENARS
jgi:hypothetical protein